MPADHPVRQDGITRPRVVVSVTATADGRVTLNRAERLLEDGPDRRWKTAWPPDVADLLARREAAIEQRHHPTVFLEGSGTFVADAAGALPLPDASEPADVLQADYLPYRSPKWFAVVDGRGRVAWTHKGDQETSLLVVARRGTPLPYLAYLRRERIPYLLAGTRHVDLTSALAKFQLQLGAQCVVSTAGGGLNGALLRAGLVDELHIITVPALTGGLGTPSVIDGPPLGPGSLPVPLRVIDVQVGTHGSIWAHYELAERPATLSADERQRRERRRVPGRRHVRPPGLRVDERDDEVVRLRHERGRARPDWSARRPDPATPAGIAETRIAIDAQLILDAAQRSIRLWPEHEG